MTEEAIQEDVSEEVVEETVVETDIKQNDDRADAIEALASQREAEILAESGKQVEEEAEEAEEIPTDDDATPKPEEPKEQLVKVKIDGEELELPISEVVKGYQKDATASKRLDQAAHERQELEQLHADIEARTKQEEAKEEQLSTDDDLTVAEKISTALDDMAVGSDEERLAAANALQELFGRGDNPTINVDEIAQQAAQQTRLQMQYDNAQQQFANDYQDIVSDPTLHQMATNVLNDAIPKSQTYEEAFKTAGDTIRQWRDNLTGTTTVSDKVALKQRLEQEPNKIGSRAEPTPKQKPETPADIIAAMKAARGQ